MISWKDIEKAQELLKIMKQAKKAENPMNSFLEEEAKAREQNIPDEAVFRHRKAMAMRAFAWYKLCKDEKQKMKLADTYNRIAMLSVRQR